MYSPDTSLRRPVPDVEAPGSDVRRPEPGADRGSAGVTTTKGTFMAERALRGMRIGAHSMESEQGVEFAPRMQAQYTCPNGHKFTMTFAVDAEVPPVWECRCNSEALLEDATRPEPAKPAR